MAGLKIRVKRKKGSAITLTTSWAKNRSREVKAELSLRFEIGETENSTAFPRKVPTQLAKQEGLGESVSSSF
jgi:hypothetical protein